MLADILGSLAVITLPLLGGYFLAALVSRFIKED